MSKHTDKNKNKNKNTDTGRKKKQGFSFRGTRFFVLVAAIYILLFFFNPDAALLSLSKAAKVLLKILPILAMVICFTGVLNYFLRPKHIARHLGEESGSMGWFWAMAAGVVSHGPMYIWYPFLEDLREHGARDGLIATFFYARAVKIPLLPLMIDYFGLVFTGVLSLYILVGALLQGLLLQRLVGRFGENQKE